MFVWLWILFKEFDIIVTSEETIQVLVKFRIIGDPRFLSHAETMRVFQRAFARAGIEIKYSSGFNPHPKLSLPLPRPVGVESDEELLCVKVKETSFDISDFKKRLLPQLSNGIELTNVEIAEKKTSFQPLKVVYLLKICEDYVDKNLQSTIKKIIAAKKLNIERRTDSAGHTKKINVRDFLESVILQDDIVQVTCNITPAGSVRIDEILELLNLNIERLSAPPKRTSVEWKDL